MTPTTSKALQETGHAVCVERSLTRIFGDKELEAVEVTLIPEGSYANAHNNRTIISLKETPGRCLFLYMYIYVYID